MNPAAHDSGSRRISPVHCLYYWANKTPNSVYLTQPFNDGTVVNYTWQQTLDEVQRMASYLLSLKLPENSHIAILGKNSAHWIMSDLAIWMAGYISVPLYPTLSGETAQYILEHSEVKLMFIGKLDGKSDTWFDVKEVISADLPCITLPMAPEFRGQEKDKSWQDIVTNTTPVNAMKLPDPDSLATLIYTSGSTGKPKGVMHDFRTLVHVAHNMEDQFGLTAEDRLLSYLPMAHCLERVIIETVSLHTGCHIFFADSLDTFVADLGRARPTMFISVPRLWMKFQSGINDKIPPTLQKILFALPILGKFLRGRILQQLGLDQVRLAVTGSAPLPPAVISWYQSLGLDLLEGYGMTENAAYSHLNPTGANRLGTVGKPLNEVICRLSDEGEVQLKGPGTMLGYYKEPEKTAETMTADGYLKTGDLGEIDSDGYLKLTGRIKDIFKTSKGKYIAPVPIELKLGESLSIEMVCVGGGILPQPIALVILDEEVQKSLHKSGDRSALETEFEALLKKVNNTLESHEKLAFIVIMKEPWTMQNGLLTPTMKIQRQKVEDTYVDEFEKWKKQNRKIVWV
tara:strand:- start:3981 stop:5693 length:1713 start_codon:yes stop_codon:yes gene_type:complete